METKTTKLTVRLTVRHFQVTDVDLKCPTPTIYVDDHHQDLVDCPLERQKKQLQETASGYGRKLTSNWKILFEGKLYRVYVTLISDAGSAWFVYKGKKIFVS